MQMTMKEYLSDRGMSMRELAKKANVEVASISRWLSGKTTPRYDSIRRIADALGCDIGTVVGFLNPPKIECVKIPGFDLLCALETLHTICVVSEILIGEDLPGRAEFAFRVAGDVLNHNWIDILQGTPEGLKKKIKPELPMTVNADDAITAANTIRYLLVVSKAIDAMTKETGSIVFCERDLLTMIRVLNEAASY